VIRPQQAMGDLGRVAWETSWWRMKKPILKRSSFKMHQIRKTSLNRA